MMITRTINRQIQGPGGIEMSSLRTLRLYCRFCCLAVIAALLVPVSHSAGQPPGQAGPAPDTNPGRDTTLLPWMNDLIIKPHFPRKTMFHRVAYFLRDSDFLTDEERAEVESLLRRAGEFVRARREMGRELRAELSPEDRNRLAFKAAAVMNEADRWMGENFPRLVELLGDHADEFVAQENAQQVWGMVYGAAQKMGMELAEGQFPLTPDLINTLSDWLELDDQQRERLTKIEQQLSERKERLEIDARRKSTSLQDEQFRAMMKVLTPEQRTMYKARFGDPMEWSLSPKDPRMRLYQDVEDTIAGRMGRMVGQSSLGLNELDRAALMAGDRGHLEDQGYHIEEYLFWEMFRLDSIQKELELVPDQVAQLRRAFLGLKKDSKTIITDQFAEDRLKALLDGTAQLPEKADSILLEHQKPEVLQIELQVRLYKYCYSFCLLSPEVKEWLGLDGKQVRELAQIKAKYAGRMLEFQELAKQNYEEQVVRFKDELNELLTDAQREKLDRVIRDGKRRMSR